MTTIRNELPADIPQVRLVNELAFAQAAEADLVDRLRATCADALSLLAVEDEAVVGYILFTPALIDSAWRRVVGMGLAPLARLPDCQRRGIGEFVMIPCGMEHLPVADDEVLVQGGRDVQHRQREKRAHHDRSRAHLIPRRRSPPPDLPFCAFCIKFYRTRYNH